MGSILRTGLDRNLSARRETGDAELLKFGETFGKDMAIPSQARTERIRPGVETRRAALDTRHPAGVR